MIAGGIRIGDLGHAQGRVGKVHPCGAGDLLRLLGRRRLGRCGGRGRGRRGDGREGEVHRLGRGNGFRLGGRRRLGGRHRRRLKGFRRGRLRGYSRRLLGGDRGPRGRADAGEPMAVPVAEDSPSGPGDHCGDGDCQKTYLDAGGHRKNGLSRRSRRGTGDRP